jgi:cytolysin (calcineurin-like family phosphatase)
VSAKRVRAGGNTMVNKKSLDWYEKALRNYETNTIDDAVFWKKAVPTTTTNTTVERIG